MNNNKVFCQAMTEFWGEPITDPKQSTQNNVKGEELAEFCDFYFKLRLETCGLKHFSSGEKKQYTIKGIILGIATALLFWICTMMKL